VAGKAEHLQRQHREHAGHQVEQRAADQGDQQRQRQADADAGRRVFAQCRACQKVYGKCWASPA
jgi:cytochrome c2